MTARRHVSAILGAAMFLAAGSALAGSYAAADNAFPDSTTTTGIAPNVEIIVYDGTSQPAVIAGCSAADCLGYAPAGTTLPYGTGTVTNPKNYVGWAVGGGDPSIAVYLYVDGKSVAAVKSLKMFTWSVHNIPAGPHNVQALAYASDGTAGWSAPLTINIVK